MQSPRKNGSRLRSAILTGFAIALVAAPTAALADPTNITTGVSSITTWVLTIAKSICILAVIGCGFAKLAGRMQWGHFFSVMTGAAIIFGASEIAGWMFTS